MTMAKATRAPAAMFDACCTRQAGMARPGTVGFWSAVGVLGVAAVAGTVPIPLYVVYQQAFGFSMLGLAVIFAGFPIGLAAALVCLGCTSDRMGRRVVLLAALALAAVSAIIFLSASSTWWLLAARFVSGVAVGVITPAAAAAIAELEPHRDLHRASMVTAVVTVGALGAGPLVAGLLAQYGGSPRTLPWQLYLGVLAVAALMMLAVPETVGDRTSGVAGIRPRLIHLPPDVRRPFTEAITTAVVGFGTLGFFSSLVPSLVKASLHRPNHALGGAVVFVLYAAAVAGQFAGKRLGRSRSIPSGLVITAVGLAVVVTAFATTTLWLLIVGAVVCGLGVGLAVMGGLALVNEVCPPGHRAEILSAFFVVTYISAAIPVVLSAVMADHGGTVAAVSMVAGLIGLLIVITLVLRLQQRGPEGLPAPGPPPRT